MIANDQTGPVDWDDLNWLLLSLGMNVLGFRTSLRVAEAMRREVRSNGIEVKKKGRGESATS